MEFDTRGLTTLECLVALMVFCAGALGASATMALALRAQTEGARAAAAGRLASATFDRLRGQIRGPQGGCLPLAPGQATGDHGVSVSWQLVPVAGGRLVQLVFSHPALPAPRSDTAWSFVGCR
jgi:hypothetical protein